MSSGIGTVETVWLVSKTHLDVGFTGLPGEVLDRFLHRYIPAAIAVTDQLDGQGPPLVWTLGSWLVWWSLEQSEPAQRRAIERAIGEGRLVWHALPFSMHTELLDGWLLDEALAISAELDRRFGRRTIAAKMTDVPGHTIALVPHLAAAGVGLLHIGVNSASQVPQTPPLFRWRAGGSEVVVAYAPTYGQVQVLPGGRALSVSVTGDNTGPPSAAQHLAQVAELADRYPGAEIVTSGLDPAAAHLLQQLDQLPVVEAEIGDSWIHGVGGDPALLARYRDLLRRRRTRRPTAGSDAAAGSDEVVSAADARQLLLIPEHTWGLDSKQVLTAEDPFDPRGFSEARQSGRFEPLERSWAAKAAWLERLHGAPAQAAEPEPARPEPEPRNAQPEPAEPEPAEPDPAEPRALAAGDHLEWGGWRVEVLASGGVRITVWPDSDGPAVEVGRYSYQSFDAGDYLRFFDAYIRPGKRGEPWVVGDFGKPGLEQQPVRAGRDTAGLTRAWCAETGATLAIMVQLDVAERAGLAYGAPRRLLARYELPAGRAEVGVSLWRSEKSACRLPEAEWYTFVVDQPDSRLFWHKIDRWIPAEPVVAGGGNRLHAIQEGVLWHRPGGPSVQLESLDSPLVAPGEGYLLDPGDGLPPVAAGASVCLTNNVWGTNFRLWNDQAVHHRFVVRLLAPGQAEALLG